MSDGDEVDETKLPANVRSKLATLALGVLTLVLAHFATVGDGF